MANRQFRLRKNLPILLKERNLSASQLAKSTGIAKQVISDWMAGVQPRKIEHLVAIADELRISIEVLCFEDDPLSHTTQHRLLSSTFETLTIKNHIEELRGIYEVHFKRIKDI